MSDKPPSHPLFDAHARQDDALGVHVDAVRERHANHRRERDRGPAPTFEPALLIRAFPGDRGTRPINVPFWESPDIWTAAGPPDTTPDVPLAPGGTPVAGVPNTLYAHVWNLGLAPVVRPDVEFFVFDPSFSFATQTPLFHATTTVDLSSRSTPTTCHHLVKCPVAWVPTVVNDGHECVVVRVSAMGDTADPAHLWDGWADRHIGQRNLAVLPAGGSIKRILDGLQVSRRLPQRVELVQVGREAEHVVQLSLPHLRVDPALRTLVLAELGVRGDLTVPATKIRDAPVPAGRGTSRSTATDEVVARIDLDVVLPVSVDQSARPAERVPLRIRRNGRVPVLHRGGTLDDLLRSLRTDEPSLAKRFPTMPPPPAGTAQVLRIAAYEGDQLVGGYTVLVHGS